MMHALPNLPNSEAFKAWRADASRWLPVALDIARGHGLPHADPHPFLTGTNLVIGLDGLVLKIFPPMLRAQFISERTSLSQLRGRVSIPIPEIVHEGERDGWPYLVITRLRGMLGAEVWATLPEDQKERVLGQIGATIAEVQRVPIGELSRIEPRWEPFMRTQIGGCGARHRRLGLPQKYWEGLDEIGPGRGDADSDGRIAGDPDRRIHSGKFPVEPRRRRLAFVGADRFRRCVDRMG